jgi:hypothetical protein
MKIELDLVLNWIDSKFIMKMIETGGFFKSKKPEVPRKEIIYLFIYFFKPGLKVPEFFNSRTRRHSYKPSTYLVVDGLRR